MTRQMMVLSMGTGYLMEAFDEHLGCSPYFANLGRKKLAFTGPANDVDEAAVEAFIAEAVRTALKMGMKESVVKVLKDQAWEYTSASLDNPGYVLFLQMLQEASDAKRRARNN